MKQQSGKISGIVLAAAILAALASAIAGAVAQTNTNTTGKARPTLTDLFGDPVVAKGKGFEIKQSQLDTEIVRSKAPYAAQGQTPPPGLDAQVLDKMVGMEVLLSRATPDDRAKAKEQFEKSLEAYKADRKLSNEDFAKQLSPQLRIQGVTREQWDKQQIDQAVVPLVLERELKVDVSDEEVKKFYDSKPAQLEEPEMVRASHILLSTKDPADPNPNMGARRDLPEDQKRARRKQMEDILKRAKAGEDFAKLASQYSDDPGSKDRGGEYIFPRGQMAPEFETAAFSLNTNQISDIVTTVFGYHIIKLNEKMPARSAALDDEVAFAAAGYMVIKKYWTGPPEVTKSARKLSAIIRQNLEGQQRQKLFPEYMAKIKKEAGVVILDDKLKVPESAAVSTPPGGQPPVKTEAK